MKPQASALNPFAALYIPLSKREGYMGGDESSWSMPPTYLSENQHHTTSFNSGVYGINRFSSPELSPGKFPSHHESHGSLLQKPGEMTYKQMRDDDLEMDMDMEYLLMAFPGLSHDSIANVYLANNGELEATIDMLSQLEMYGSESGEHLPDSLDIGDVSDSGPSVSPASRSKTVSAEGAAASSPSRDGAVSF